MTLSPGIIEKIDNWPSGKAGDTSEWLRFCASVWDCQYGSVRDQKEEGRWLVEFATEGWITNEVILTAMRMNDRLWKECWHSSYRGGRHKFSVERYRSKS